MPFPIVDGLVPISLIAAAGFSNTSASAVIDREDFNGQTSLLVLLHMGSVMSDTASGFDIRLTQSDTFSGTASDGTAITSAHTSGQTFTNSGQFMGITMDLRDKGRFIGVILSAPSGGSGIAAVIGILGDAAVVPAPAANDGFVSVNRIGQ